MEIISFVDASSENKFKMPEIDLHTLSLQNPFGKVSIRHFVKSLFTKVRGISFDTAKIGAYAWLVLTAVLIVAVPAGICKAVNYYSSFAAPVEFASLDTELSNLDSLMNKFAMENDSDLFDENGNVLLEDGTVLTASSLGIGQSVSYQTYKVKNGESISTISRKFGLTNISTLIAVNGIDNVRTLREGQKLKIPSMDGLIHRVKKGESLTGISSKYNVSLEKLCDTNDLSTQVLFAGQELFIPGARLDSSELKKAMGELFANPISASYRLSSRFGPRKDPFTGVASNHTGIDMACPKGTPISATMSGKVVYVGWSNVFGNYVIINHGNGYQSLYGHMSKATCKTGQTVNQGTKIGLVGSTGYSTGNHLHFTVYKNGKLVDPLSLIKR